MAPANQKLPQQFRQPYTLRSPTDLRVRYFTHSRDVIDLSGVLLSVDWEHDETYASPVFNITLDNYGGQATRWVRAGGVVVLDYRLPKRWEEWHRGTVVVDEPAFDESGQTLAITSFNPLHTLGIAEGKFAFKPNRTATESIRDTLRRARLPVGGLIDTKVKLGAFTHEGTWYEALTSLLDKTFKQSGKRYVLEFALGKVWLFRYDEPVWQYNGSGIARSMRARTSIEQAVTRLRLYGQESVVTGKKAKDKQVLTRQRFSVATANAEMLRGFGLIEVVKDAESAMVGAKKQRKQAANRLRQRLTPEREIELVLPFESLTLNRLQTIRFPRREPITRAFGRYYVNSLSGHLGEDGSSMTLKLGRSPEFPDPPDAVTGLTATDYPGDQNPAAVAAWMGSHAQERGLPPELPVMAALVESGLKNLQYGDRDSLGFFQIRHKLHKIPRERVLDPDFQIDWFLDRAEEVDAKAKPPYSERGPAAYGEWCQAIERSAFPGRYQPRLQEARRLLGIA